MSRPRLLIVGASGFLGQHLARRAADPFEVFPADLAAPPGPRGLALDITSADAVKAAFAQVAPDVVILLAAISDIDACERQPVLAQAVNVEGAEQVAAACARSGARLVFTSSAAVFDGTRQGYSETDPPTPLSVYGRTKAAAEVAVSSALPSVVILRMALVIGFAEGAGTNAMLNTFAARLSAGQIVALPDYEFRNPVDAATLSCFVLELLRTDARGIFHVGAADAVSRYELGRMLAEKMGYRPDLVRAQAEPLPGRAPRGLHHFLLTGKLRAACRTPVPTCGQVIERAIHGSTQSYS